MKLFNATRSGQIAIRGFVFLGAVSGLVGLRSALAFSETLPDRVSRLVKTVLAIFTALVAGFTGPVLKIQNPPAPVPAHPIHLLNGSKSPTLTLVSGETQSDLHLFTYTFKGQAMHQGEACALASVLIRVDAPNGQQTKQVTADQEGRYSVPFHIYARKYEPIHWSIQARAGRTEYVRLAGQRICMTEENNVTFNGNVELAQLYAETDSPNPVMHEPNHSEDLE